jgi:phosphoribosylglycinamide formyltransferase-1
MRLAILISGSGTTAKSIIEACQEGRLKNVEPAIVISSKNDAPGIEKAKSLGIETRVVSPKDYSNSIAFGEKLLEIFREFKVDFISQNGWLPLTPVNVVKEYQGRIINQHPGPLDPGRKLDFGGKGMYGKRVTCARIVYAFLTKEKNPWTEATVHFVNEEYDKGDLLRIEKMNFPPLFGKFDENLILVKTLELQEKLLPLEHENVINALKKIVEGKAKGFRRKRPLIPKKNEKILLKAKEIAIKLFPYG